MNRRVCGVLDRHLPARSVHDDSLPQVGRARVGFPHGCSSRGVRRGGRRPDGRFPRAGTRLGGPARGGFQARRWGPRERAAVAFAGVTTLLCGTLLFLLGAAAATVLG